MASSAPNTSTSLSRFTEPMLNVVVGEAPSQQTFLIHPSILTQSSPFFQRALRQEWKDLRPDHNTLTLDDDDPAIFHIYLTWLYANCPVSRHHDFRVDDDIVEDPLKALVHCYIFAEKYLDNHFKDAVVWAIFNGETCPELPEIRLLYQKTAPISGYSIRQLCVDMYLHEDLPVDEGLFDQGLAEFEKDLWEELDMMEGIGWDPPPWERPYTASVFFTEDQETAWDGEW